MSSSFLAKQALYFWVQVVWHNYVQAMRTAGFSQDVVLYGASGLLTYGANDGAALADLHTNMYHYVCHAGMHAPAPVQPLRLH